MGELTGLDWEGSLSPRHPETAPEPMRCIRPVQHRIAYPAVKVGLTGSEHVGTVRRPAERLWIFPYRVATVG